MNGKKVIFVRTVTAKKLTTAQRDVFQVLRETALENGFGITSDDVSQERQVAALIAGGEEGHEKGFEAGRLEGYELGYQEGREKALLELLGEDPTDLSAQLADAHEQIEDLLELLEMVSNMQLEFQAEVAKAIRPRRERYDVSKASAAAAVDHEDAQDDESLADIVFGEEVVEETPVAPPVLSAADQARAKLAARLGKVSEVPGETKTPVAPAMEEKAEVKFEIVEEAPKKETTVGGHTLRRTPAVNPETDAASKRANGHTEAPRREREHTRRLEAPARTETVTPTSSKAPAKEESNGGVLETGRGLIGSFVNRLREEAKRK